MEYIFHITSRFPFCKQIQHQIPGTDGKSASFRQRKAPGTSPRSLFPHINAYFASNDIAKDGVSSGDGGLSSLDKTKKMGLSTSNASGLLDAGRTGVAGASARTIILGSSLDEGIKTERTRAEFVQESLDLDEDDFNLNDLKKRSLSLDEEENELDGRIYHQDILKNDREKLKLESPTDSLRHMARPVLQNKSSNSAWGRVFKQRMSMGSHEVSKAVFDAGIHVGSPMDCSKNQAAAKSALTTNSITSESQDVNLLVQKNGAGRNFDVGSSRFIKPTRALRADTHHPSLPPVPPVSAVVMEFWAARFPPARAQQMARKTAQIGVCDEGGLDCLCYEDLVTDEDVAADFGLWGDEVR